MKRALLVALLVGVAACDEPVPDEPEVVWPDLPAAPATRDVVDAALADAPPAPAPATLAEESVDDFEGLLGFVAESSGDLRTVGAQDLWRLGDGVGAALRDAALDGARPDAERAAALGVLGAGEAPRASTLLLAVLEGAAEPWVRGSAAWYLGEREDEGWICDAVLRLKYETDESVVVYLAQALGKHEVLAGLSGLEVISRSSWSEGQRASAEAVIQQMAAGLTEEQLMTPRARDARFDAAVWGWIARLSEFQLRGVDDARFILKNLGADAVPHLSAALVDDDRYVRLHACQCLERMGAKANGAIDALLEQLGAPDLGPQAAVTLGAVSRTTGEDGRVRVALVALMRNESAPPGLRLGATRGLVRMGDPAAVDPLLAQFALERERWPELAQAVAEALVTSNALGTRAGDGTERDGRIAAAYRFAVDSLDTPGLDPASTGAAWEQAFERGLGEGLEDVPEAWAAIGAKRGPEFDAVAMWRERKVLLERELGGVLR